MTSANLEIPARALAIGAHPDDIEFGCGATLAKWAAAGCDVHMLVLTDGSKGTWEGAAERDALVATREQEQRAAADALGASQAHLLGLVDGELESGLAQRAMVCRVIREIGPNVVLGHDPWKRYRLHPDHRHAGFLTIDGIVAARDPHFFPDQALAAHRPDLLLLFEADVIDHLESVEESLDAKLAALLCHRSQWRSTMGIDVTSAELGVQLAAFEHRVRTEATVAGELLGGGSFEAFKLLGDL